MQITVNGERREVAGPLTVAALLNELRLDPRLVVVEHNRQLVKRSALTDTFVQSHDTFEIIRIVGGGSE